MSIMPIIVSAPAIIMLAVVSAFSIREAGYSFDLRRKKRTNAA